MKKKYLLLLILLVVQLFAVIHWLPCRGFPDNFHFSSLDLELRIIEGIHSDQNVPLWMVRAFHNKLIGTTFDIFGAYLQFWNVSFLAGFISLAGIVGIGAQFYYFFAQKRTIWLWLLFGAVLLMPFAEVLNLAKSLPFAIRLGLVSLPYLVWSMLGYWQFFREKKVNMKIIYAVLIISVWYLVAFLPAGVICSLQ